MCHRSCSFLLCICSTWHSSCLVHWSIFSEVVVELLTSFLLVQLVVHSPLEVNIILGRCSTPQPLRVCGKCFRHIVKHNDMFSCPSNMFQRSLTIIPVCFIVFCARCPNPASSSYLRDKAFSQSFNCSSWYIYIWLYRPLSITHRHFLFCGISPQSCHNYSSFASITVPFGFYCSFSFSDVPMLMSTMFRYFLCLFLWLECGDARVAELEVMHSVFFDSRDRWAGLLCTHVRDHAPVWPAYL